MITHEQKKRLGIFLLISLLALIVTLIFFLAPRLRDQGDEYLVRFRGISVNGLNIGSSVKYQGVEIGRVSEITVDPDDLNAVLVKIKVRALFPMKENMEVKLQFLGITGIRYLEISGGTNQAKRLRKGSELPIGRGLGEQAEDVVSNIDEAVKNLNLLLHTENLDKISQFLTNLQKSSQILSETISGQAETVKTAIDKLNETGTDLKVTAQNLQEITAAIREGIQSVSLSTVFKKSERILSEMENRLSDQELGRSISQINKVLETADITIKKAGSLFVSQQEEISKTLSSLREAMENLSLLTRDLSEDPSSLIRSRKEARRKK